MVEGARDGRYGNLAFLPARVITQGTRVITVWTLPSQNNYLSIYISETIYIFRYILSE